MIYIKTYENFISKSLGKIWNKLTEPSEHGQLIPADWNPTEVKKLQSVGFTVIPIIGKVNFEYSSVMSDFKINIDKYYDEQIPGYAPALYKIHVVNPDKFYSKEFSDIDKLIDFVKSIMPEEELDAKKYNL